MSALELDDATPAWRSWATVRLGLIRGAVFAPAAMLVTTEPTLVVAAWVPFAMTLFEAWAKPRARTNGRILMITVAAFVIASVGLAATFYQSWYVMAFWRTRSLATALAELQSVGFRDVIGAATLAECGGIGIAMSTAVRMRASIAAAVFLAAVIGLPLLPTALAEITRHSDPSRQLFTAFFLAAGGAIAALGNELLRAVANVIDRRLAARESAA